MMTRGIVGKCGVQGQPLATFFLFIELGYACGCDTINIFEALILGSVVIFIAPYTVFMLVK